MLVPQQVAYHQGSYQPSDNQLAQSPEQLGENTPLKMFCLLYHLICLTRSLSDKAYLLFSKNNNISTSPRTSCLWIIGINVAMGLVCLPRVHDYWSTSPTFGLPWFSAIMPRTRLYEISKYLHLADASKQKKKEEDGYDPLYKVRSWLWPPIQREKMVMTPYKKGEYGYDPLYKGRRWLWPPIQREKMVMTPYKKGEDGYDPLYKVRRWLWPPIQSEKMVMTPYTKWEDGYDPLYKGRWLKGEDGYDPLYKGRRLWPPIQRDKMVMTPYTKGEDGYDPL